MTIPSAQIDILVDAIRKGLDLQSAGDIAGVSASSLSRWTSNPDNDTQRRNGERIREAAGLYAADAIAGITASGARGHEWNMEHNPTYRDRFGARVETDAATASVQVLAALASSFAARAALPAAPLTQLLAESNDVLSD